MSRVVYADNSATPDQELLRDAHQVRVVSESEEGNGVNALPGGVFGFTYSPGLPNSPLFAIRRYRTYETHKLPSGDVFLIGFARPDVARELSTSTQDMTLQIHPMPEADYTTLVTIPYSRVRHHRQYAAPNQDGFTVTVGPSARDATP